MRLASRMSDIAKRSVQQHSEEVPEEVTEKEMMEAFKTLDLDHDGVITAAELYHVMATLGEKMSKDEIDEMIRQADMNCDGVIDYPGKPPT